MWSNLETMPLSWEALERAKEGLILLHIPPPTRGIQSVPYIFNREPEILIDLNKVKATPEEYEAIKDAVFLRATLQTDSQKVILSSGVEVIVNAYSVDLPKDLDFYRDYYK